MRRIRLLLGVGLVAGLGLSGCAWTEKEIRPKPPAAEFRAPPEDDPRYAKYHEYPKEALENDNVPKKSSSAMKAMPGAMGGGRMGAGGGGAGPGSSPSGF